MVPLRNLIDTQKTSAQRLTEFNVFVLKATVMIPPLRHCTVVVCDARQQQQQQRAHRRVVVVDDDRWS